MDSLEGEDLDLYLTLVGQVAEETGRDIAEVAAAAARLARGDKPLTLAVQEQPADLAPSEDGMVRLVIDAGREQGVRAGDIVGAIANEADIPGKAIGAIDIYDRFTFVEVPQEYREAVLTAMAGAEIRRMPVNVRLAVARDVAEAPARPERPPRGAHPPFGDARRHGPYGEGGHGGPWPAPAAAGTRAGRSQPGRATALPACGRGPTSRPSGGWKPRPGGKPERPPHKK